MCIGAGGVDSDCREPPLTHRLGWGEIRESPAVDHSHELADSGDFVLSRNLVDREDHDLHRRGEPLGLLCPSQRVQLGDHQLAKPVGRSAAVLAMTTANGSANRSLRTPPGMESSTHSTTPERETKTDTSSAASANAVDPST